VQIAAGQNAGCAEQAVSAGQKLEKQRICAAKEGECVLAEQRQFQEQPIDIAPLVLR
jgi:hypothetical protein